MAFCSSPVAFWPLKDLTGQQNPSGSFVLFGNGFPGNTSNPLSESSEIRCIYERLNFACTSLVFSVGVDIVEFVYAHTHSAAGWTIMGNNTQDLETLLVKECLAGSEQAWNEFYFRYVGLVKSVVRRQPAVRFQDVDDVTQSIFTALIRGLKDYDKGFPLPRFVCIVAERVCIQEYRRTTAAKRDGQTDPVDHHDTGRQDEKILHSHNVSQEEQLEQNQLLEVMRRSLRRLGSGCRELLRLRYFEELPYKEIARLLGATENTLTVQARRCLDELGANYHELVRRGVRK